MNARFSSLISGQKHLFSTLAFIFKRHPKQVTTTLAVLLLAAAGGAGGAFTVATLSPDAATVPTQEVIENVKPLDIGSQVSALEAFGFSLFRSDTTRSSDTAEILLKRLGVLDFEAAAFLRADSNFYSKVLGRAGRNVKVETSDKHELIKLTATWVNGEDSYFERLVVEKTAQGFKSHLETAPLVARDRLGSGTIRHSLFSATDEAQIPDAIAVQMAEIFSGDIDFHRNVQKGDHFSVVYESLEADGEPVRTGKVLCAEFVNKGKAYQAIWFEEKGQKGGYYTLEGQNLRKAFLASPLAFSRITSGFKMRFHPILKKWRAHLGLDYAATTGTPVRSVAEGVVEFAGRQNGFGNVVYIEHRDKKTTVYAHLSRIAVRSGQRVSQGQNIGAVGATGWATGPHLHFEFRVNGQHKDPATIAQNYENKALSVSERPRFNYLVNTMRSQLAAANALVQANAN